MNELAMKKKIMNTLYVSDLDGTLLQADKTPSEFTISILNELIAKGLMFTIATARTIASSKIILKDLKLNLPVILMNGVCIYDTLANKYIKVEALDNNSKDFLISIIQEYKLSGFAYAIEDNAMSTYYEELKSQAQIDFYEERRAKYYKTFTQLNSFSELRDKPLVYFSTSGSKTSLLPIYNAISNLSSLNCVFYEDNYDPKSWYLEIFNRNASKYHAVQFLREYVKADKVICFGDNHNDMSLFDAGDYTCAVGNAVEALKAKADEIIGNNMDDGVAKWIRCRHFEEDML